MPFTKTPMGTSEETKPVSLLYQWDCRDNAAGGNDTVLKNALFEPIGQEYFHMMKRNGTESIALSPAPNGSIIGIYYWARPTTNALVVVYLDAVGVGEVAFYDASTFNRIGSPSTLTGPNTGDLEITFQEFLYQNGTVDLMFMVASNLFRVTPALAVSLVTTGITLAGPSIAYLDGYLFAHDQAAIYNSNLNDPTIWSASNFISTDSYSDGLIKIARVGPYLVAFGNESIQYYYDAANPTGTPLGANTGATRRIGYIAGFANFGDDVLFIGTSNQSNPALYRMSGLKVNDVASFPFSRMWNGQSSIQSAVVGAPNGAILNLNGHNVYFVRTASTPFPASPTPPSPLTGASYIYDLDSQIWSKIGYKAQEFYLIKSTATFTQTTNVPRMTYFSVLGDSVVHRFSPTIYQDDGVNFEVKFRTRMLDFGTRRNKFGSRFLVTSDQTATSSLAQFSWSVDDYKTTSTPRSVDLQFNYKQLYALGSFYALSFTMTYSDNFPMRWQNLELDYDVGEA